MPSQNGSNGHFHTHGFDRSTSPDFVGGTLESTQRCSPLAAEDHSAQHRPESYVEASEAAEFLKYNPKTLLRLAREGQIPAHPVTGFQRRRWRFLISELDGWARGKVNSGCHPCQKLRRM
jgi:excisionase family DNA binding protein